LLEYILCPNWTLLEYAYEKHTQKFYDWYAFLCSISSVVCKPKQLGMPNWNTKHRIAQKPNILNLKSNKEKNHNRWLAPLLITYYVVTDWGLNKPSYLYFVYLYKRLGGRSLYISHGKCPFFSKLDKALLNDKI